MVEFRYEHLGKAYQQYREVVASNGFSSQGDKRLLVGLGEYTGAVTVTINWCGSATTRQLLEPGQYHRIQQAQSLATVK